MTKLEKWGLKSILLKLSSISKKGFGDSYLPDDAARGKEKNLIPEISKRLNNSYFKVKKVN